MITVEDFLEHRGVKGMKWGVRKARSNKPVSSGHAKAKKVAGVALVAGATAATVVLENHGRTKLSRLRL